MTRPQPGRPSALWVGLLAALCALSASAAISMFPISGCETFMHLAIGREAAQTGRLVSVEFFSTTQNPGAISGASWLGNMALYHMHSSFGIDGLVLVRAVIGALAGLLLHLAARVSGAGFVTSGLLSIGAISAGLYSGWGIGPELFGYLLIAVLQALLIGHIEGRVGFRWLYAVPLLLLALDAFDIKGAFWGALYLCVIIAVLALSLPSQRSLRGDALKRLKVFGIIAMASAGLMALHPHGLRTGFVNWGPANVSYSYLALAWAAGGALVYLRGRASVHRASVALVFLAAAPFVEGGAAVAAMVTVPLVAEAVGKMERPGNLVRLIAGAAIVLVLSGLFYAKAYGQFRLGLGVDGQSVPDASLGFMKASGIEGNIHHPPEFGGCVAFYLYPAMRVMEGDMLADDTENSITLALVRNTHGRAVFGDDWAPVYWDAASEVYLRRVKRNQKAISEFGLESITPDMEPGLIVEKASSSPHLAPALAKEAAQLLGYHRDDSLSDALARVLMVQGFPPDEGLKSAEAALKANSDNIMLRAAWGLHLYQSGGSREEAEKAMSAGLRLMPDSGPLALGLAYLHYDSGRHAEAYREFERLVGLGGAEGRRALYGRALTLMKLGREEEGRRDMEKYLAGQR